MLLIAGGNQQVVAHIPQSQSTARAPGPSQPFPIVEGSELIQGNPALLRLKDGLLGSQSDPGWKQVVDAHGDGGKETATP